jgi:alpha-beta hydrolase superfamily lysophospholipase
MGSFARALIWIGSAVLAGAGFLAGVGGPLLCENALRPLRQTVAARPSWETVTIRPAGGPRLAAWFLRPAQAGPADAGCVMILHGIGDTRAGGLGLAPMFLEKGYAVLLPDTRGHGESGGETISYGVIERWDALAWAGWLRAGGCREVFGLGESMGAAILLQAAAERPAFRAVVAECPFASLRWIAEDRIVQRLSGPPAFRRAVARILVTGGFWYARLRYRLDLDAAAPVRSVERLRTPVLLIQGLEDANVSPAHARAIAASGRCVTLWLVPGAGHTGAAAADPEGFRRRVLGWFQAAARAG